MTECIFMEQSTTASPRLGELDGSRMKMMDTRRCTVTWTAYVSPHLVTLANASRMGMCTATTVIIAIGEDPDSKAAYQKARENADPPIAYHVRERHYKLQNRT